MSARKNFFRFMAIAAIVILILLSLAPIVYVFAPQQTPVSKTPLPPVATPGTPPPVDNGP